MKKLATLLALIIVVQTLTGCRDVMPQAVRSNTAVTFTILAVTQPAGDRAVPLISITATIPGFAPLMFNPTPAPYRFAFDSVVYPAAARQIDVVATLIDPNPNVVLTCTWAAMTPAGERLSRDSVGGEGESELGGPVFCRYVA